MGRIVNRTKIFFLLIFGAILINGRKKKMLQWIAQSEKRKAQK